MGWEERGDGRYYYRKMRHGNRVVSAYVGRGALVELLAEEAAQERARASAAAARDRAARDAMAAEDAPLDVLEEMVDVLTTAALLAAGCHTHKGTWRRAR